MNKENSKALLQSKKLEQLRRANQEKMARLGIKPSRNLNHAKPESKPQTSDLYAASNYPLDSFKMDDFKSHNKSQGLGPDYASHQSREFLFRPDRVAELADPYRLPFEPTSHNASESGMSYLPPSICLRVNVSTQGKSYQPRSKRYSDQASAFKGVRGQPRGSESSARLQLYTRGENRIPGRLQNQGRVSSQASLGLIRRQKEKPKQQSYAGRVRQYSYSREADSASGYGGRALMHQEQDSQRLSVGREYRPNHFSDKRQLGIRQSSSSSALAARAQRRQQQPSSANPCISSIELINNKIKYLLGLGSTPKQPGPQSSRQQTSRASNGRKSIEIGGLQQRGRLSLKPQWQQTSHLKSIDLKDASIQQVTERVVERQNSTVFKSTLKESQHNFELKVEASEASRTKDAQGQGQAMPTSREGGSSELRKSISLSRGELCKLKSKEQQRQQKMSQWRKMYGQWADKCQKLAEWSPCSEQEGETRRQGEQSLQRDTFATEAMLDQEDGEDRRLRQSRPLKKMMDAFRRQVELDSDLRNNKRALQLKVGAGEYDSAIVDMLRARGVEAALDQVRAMFVAGSDQFNPFAETNRAVSLQDLIDSYVRAETHFEQQLKGAFSGEQVEQLRTRLGEGGLEDLVRLVNIESGEQYRTRDLVLVWRRGGGLSGLNKVLRRGE